MIINSSARPSGHPGGVSHLSTSRCCSTKLFPSKLSTGRHQQWLQMLLHKPAASQCGLYKIKQTAFSTWYGTKRERENKRLAALAYGRKTALALGPVLFAQYMRVCLWMFVCNFVWLFHPLATRPSANCLLSCETKAWQAGKPQRHHGGAEVSETRNVNLCHLENQTNPRHKHGEVGMNCKRRCWKNKLVISSDTLMDTTHRSYCKGNCKMHTK